MTAVQLPELLDDRLSQGLDANVYEKSHGTCPRDKELYLTLARFLCD